MRKYFMSHIDFSEIINVTTDAQQLEYAKQRMTELKLMTEKGNPAVGEINKLAADEAKSFFPKLERRLINRNGGIALTKDTLQKLNERKDYYGVYMYIAFLYGFLEWQVPSKIALLPAVPDTLKCFCSEFSRLFNKYITDNIQKESGDTDQDGKQANL